MQKILIVDDEAFELLMLEHMIERLYPEQFHVHTAENGRTAIAAVIEDPPDIVFMDIEMPGIDGIEAAKQIRALHPKTVVFFLSAHKEFTYAQNAVSAGAAEYLLKPISDVAFTNAIDKGLSIIQQEKQRSRKISLIGEQFLSLLLSGHPDDIASQGFSGIFSAATVVGTIGIIKGLAPQDASYMDEMIRSALAIQGIQLVLLEYDSLHVALFTSATFEGFKEALEHVLSTAVITLLNRHSPEITIAIASPFDNIAEAYDAFSAANLFLKSGRGTGPVSFCPPRSSRLEEQIYGELINGDVAQAVDTFRRQFSSTDACILLQRLLHFLDERALQNFGYRFQMETPDGFDRWSQTSVLAWTEYCFREYRARFDEASKENEASIIRSIKQYVHDHYTSDLFLSDVAAAMNYSEAYFSRLFSQNFGESFTTYLTGVRMDAAKSLLLATNRSIKTISLTVGYKNPNYFTKVFRRATGLSPSEYRVAQLNRRLETE